MTAHQGPVYCVAWHPEERSLLATGGRDQFIQVIFEHFKTQLTKVWDLNPSTQGKPIYSVQTISSVSHIDWRPSFKYHIASSGLVDRHVHVWNLKKPFIPIASFVGHTDGVSHFKWGKGSSMDIISCAKDNTIRKQTMKNSYKSFEHIRTVCLNWNPDESLLLLADKVKRTVADETPEAPPTPKPASQLSTSSSTSTFTSFFKRTATKDLESLVTLADPSDSIPPSPVKEKKGVVHFLYPPETRHILSNGNIYSTISEDLGLLNHTTCTYFATHYRLYDKSFNDLCDCNSDVAAQIGRFHVATSWQLIKLLCENANPQKVKKVIRKVNTIQDLKTKRTESEEETNTNNILSVSDSFQDLAVISSSMSTDDFQSPQHPQQQLSTKSDRFSFFATEIEPIPKPTNILDDILPSVPTLFTLANPPS